MNQKLDYQSIFTSKTLKQLFPEHLTDEFFDALLGDSKEGAYDIRLAYCGSNDNRLTFELQLHQRQGKCLACNLTYGLPTVFSRHPIINISGLVAKIEKLLDGKAQLEQWSLGRTHEISKALHVIPLYIHLVA
ncbi:MAG: pancreas/duodenum homeobox protein 1 [Desulfobacteraceae bacterium]